MLIIDKPVGRRKFKIQKNSSRKSWQYIDNISLPATYLTIKLGNNMLIKTRVNTTHNYVLLVKEEKWPMTV